MRFAYADPPYLGCCSLYDHFHGDDGCCWDDPDTHRQLISRLVSDYPDGWALSGTSGSLRALLPMCPDDVRVCAWVKPFAVFKPNVGLAYAWEPVILRGGRRITRDQPTVRDWTAESIALKRGLTGAKPVGFVHWLLRALNVEPGDEIDDLFVGSGAVTEAIDGFFGGLPTGPGSLFEESA